LAQQTPRSGIAGNKPYSLRNTSTGCVPERHFALFFHIEDAEMSKLNGKVAVITGGSSGIGLATAKRFVQEGAYVYITGRRQSELDKAAAEIGSRVTAVRGDVSNLEELDALYTKIAADSGKSISSWRARAS
jgi:NADPH:quinone reductase-like Zn-dependent oxidoreductase